jgi:hypothetical protein
MIRTAAGVAAFLGCLALVIWLIWLVNRPQQTGVVLVGADYATNLSVSQNVLGWEGLTAIERILQRRRPSALFTPASIQLVRGVPLRTLQAADEWGDLITSLSKGFREQTLLIVLALHGGTEGGRAYLMPDAMTRPEEGLDLRKVIDSMKELPPDKPKVLVLDGALVPADWRLGMLHNDFARELKNLEPEIKKVRNLWVLSSCGPDQRSWASEGLGRTVFGHYLIEALSGKAAGPEGLTLAKLHSYLSANVRKWVWNARGAIQEPMLLPEPPARGGRDSGPARLDASRVHLASAFAAQAQEPPQFDSESLKKEWVRFGQLEALVPHPAVYAPQRWREYLDSLTRYEELVRAAGAAAGSPAEQMARRLGSLVAELRAGQFLKISPSSLETSFAMNALAGGVVEPPGPPPRPFVEFAHPSSDTDAGKLWAALESTAGSNESDQRRSPRSRVGEYLLGFAAENPLKNLQLAADRINTSRGSDDLFPVEAHFLRMLNTYLPPLRDRLKLQGSVKRALALRAQAERAAMGVAGTAGEYHYSEQLQSWLGPIVEPADARRRLGEDQLFSESEQDWGQANDDLEAAARGYDEAQSRGRRIRVALASRDRMFASLPGYSRWLAHRPPEQLQDPLCDQLSDIWIKTHKLDQLLQNPSGGVDPVALERLAREIESPYKQVVAQFREQVTADKERVSEDWEAMSAAAAVAFQDTDELNARSSIWLRLENIREKDKALTQTLASGSTAEPPADAHKLALEQTRLRAKIQGIMALSALGEDCFQDSAFKGQQQADYKKTWELVQNLANGDRKGGEPWWEDAASAGSHIGQRWRGLAQEIPKLASEENGITNLRAFQDELKRADRLARLVNSEPDQTAEPGGRLRALRAHDLLIWLATRAWLDHWYNEKPQATPYYRTLAGRYLTDAGKLFPGLEGFDQKARDLVNASGGLELESRSSPVLTSELSAPISFSVIDAGTVPEGIPTVKPSPSPPLDLAGDASLSRAVRRKQGGGIADFRISSRSIIEAEKRQAEDHPDFRKPRNDQALFRTNGFFRGQTFSKTIEVALHPVPDKVAIGPAAPDPPLASVAVRASRDVIDRFGVGTGAIAIVLDCSGSMGEDGDGRKWKHARIALREVLSQVPKGTIVSLWTFSQLALPLPPSDNPVYHEPERTIRQLRPPSRWDPSQVDGLIKELDGLRPYLHTPLVRAMWTAADKDLRDVRGLKTLLVLTDGQDNRFATDDTINPAPRVDIPTFIANKFGPLRIRINMVYFTAFGVPAELKQARADFEQPLARLEIPGKFTSAADLPGIVALLKQAVEQKLVCKIERADGSLVSDELLEVTDRDRGETEKWWLAGLDPATYRIRVLADQSYRKEINLEKGERLIVQLAVGPGEEIEFDRALYGEDFKGRENPSEDTPGWRLTALANRQFRSGGVDRLAMLIAVEAKARLKPLAQLNPQLVWFGLSGLDLPRPDLQIALRWRERVMYPAPVWQLNVPQWVTGAAAGAAPAAGPKAAGAAPVILKAWWLDPARKLPAGVIQEVELNESEAAQEVPLPDGGVLYIDSVGLEKEHLVEVRPGEPPQPQPNCLVVRLTYPKGKPYLVDPGSFKQPEVPGYEHRLYSQAGKYTGLFWPINESQREKIKRLRIISLERCRQEAEKQQNSINLKLTSPGSDEQLPEPPPAIRR